MASQQVLGKRFADQSSGLNQSGGTDQSGGNAPAQKKQKQRTKKGDGGLTKPPPSQVRDQWLDRVRLAWTNLEDECNQWRTADKARRRAAGDKDKYQAPQNSVLRQAEWAHIAQIEKNMTDEDIAWSWLELLGKGPWVNDSKDVRRFPVMRQVDFGYIINAYNNSIGKAVNRHMALLSDLAAGKTVRARKRTQTTASKPKATKPHPYKGMKLKDPANDGQQEGNDAGDGSGVQDPPSQDVLAPPMQPDPLLYLPLDGPLPTLPAELGTPADPVMGYPLEPSMQPDPLLYHPLDEPLPTLPADLGTSADPVLEYPLAPSTQPDPLFYLPLDDPLLTFPSDLSIPADPVLECPLVPSGQSDPLLYLPLDEPLPTLPTELKTSADPIMGYFPAPSMPLDPFAEFTNHEDYY